MWRWLMGALAVLSGGGALAQGENISPGVYYCITDRMAGIQPQAVDAVATEARVSGQMKPRTPTFAVTIEKYAPYGDSADCRRGGPVADLACTSAQWVAKLPEDKADMFGIRLYARDTPNVYHAGTAIFWIAADGSYSLARLFGNKGNSVEEGRCQTLQW